MQKKKQQIFAVVAIVLGLSILNYPTVVKTINYFFAYQDIVEYEKQSNNANAEKVSHDLELINIYNRSLIGNTPYDPFTDKTPEVASEYQDIDFLKENANLGYIKIPSIGLMTPVHYGTTKRVLDENLGMLVGSSLPTSELGVHTVISGHTGMVTRKLFSDLHKVKENDLFFIFTNSQKLAYRVDQIKVVKPDENQDLYIDPLHNYATLITCTPIGINDHRLLVRGTLIEYDFSNESNIRFGAGISIWDVINIILLVLSIAVIAIIITFVISQNRKENKQTRKTSAKTKKQK